MDKETFLTLADELRAAAAAYYAGDGSQDMDDATYDAGIRQLRAAAAELRALAAECLAMADAAPCEIIGRAAQRRAQIFRSAAEVADHASWNAE